MTHIEISINNLRKQPNSQQRPNDLSRTVLLFGGFTVADMWWGLRSVWSAVKYCMLVLIIIIVQVSLPVVLNCLDSNFPI